MDRLIFGHSFAVLLALILFPGLALYFLNKKKASVHGNAEDAYTGASSSLTAATGTNAGGSNLSSTETNNGASSSSTTPIENHYEVFLSFRGRDTRKGFTDHLYNGLINAGIDAFKDEKELREGRKIGPDLFAAIKNSKILIPIISVNYGTSSWCLNELVQIMECKNNTRQIVLPIFYKVEPSHVGHQIGSFGDAFHKRERRLQGRRFDPMILKKWKQALNEVSSLKGWDAEGHEGELVKSVVREVLSELKKKFELDIPENLVGIDSRVEKVVKFVDNNSHATLFVGIHGMGGIGKTTIAKTIYNKLSNQFEYRSFIADIRESCKHGVKHLQNQLISDILKQENQVSNKDEGIKFLSSKFKGKKVLILLDDVDDDDHLKALAGNHKWFSSGSVIIITTRDESILNKAYVDYKHEHEELDIDTSLILFSRHAFRKDAPPSEFEVLTHDVVSVTGGLPLSLEVLGSFLNNKKPNIWRDTINKLMEVPPQKVQEKLSISYRALDYKQKQIFLDIACFFIGTDRRIASYMWDACGFFPNEGIEVLRLMSLIKVGDDHKLRMHDQLRDFGRDIVRKENEKEPQYRSRLWDSEEVMKVLKRNKGTEKIEAVYLSSGTAACLGGKIHADEQFKNLTRLRFLHASGAQFSGDFKNSIEELRWLRWHNCPFTFEAENFHIEELVALELSESEISDKWRGWDFIKMAKNLKVLDLYRCGSLEGTFFLSAFKNLEVLILRYCRRLNEIDSSIGDMESLVRLDLERCEMLKELPNSIGALQNLEILNIMESGIKELPDSIGALKNLEILDIRSTKIKELPAGIGRLKKLQKLNTFWCWELQSLPVLPSSLTDLYVTCQSLRLSSLFHLTHLKELYLVFCKVLDFISELPSSIQELSECSQLADVEESGLQKSLNTPFKLEMLHIHGGEFREILDISQLNHLRILSVMSCTNMLEVRGLDRLKSLEILTIDECGPIERLDLSKSEGIKKLCVETCENLVEIQGLNRLESLEEISVSGCALLVRLDLPKSKVLKIFNAKYCKNLVEIQGLDRLEFLERIDISGCTSIQRLDLPKSKGLKKLYVRSCENLFEIQGLDKLEFLKVLNMSGCTSFGRLPDLFCFDTLNKLAINCCDNLHDIQSLERFPSCTSLWIEDYKSLAKFPNLSNFRNLRTLFLSNCHELQEIPGLEESTSLERIAISGCSSIEILPDLSSCTDLISLVVQDCEKLTELRGLEKLEQLVELDISGCMSLKTIPELSGTRIYQNYEEDSQGLYEAMREFELFKWDESEFEMVDIT
ncbi:disease resistance protein L6-like [Syzygium oleosum]|uniref:disease resistance protein L6-like n=1 Tax=Syzygium oleosum TaxID=219896 RepID=UPI0024B9DC27|nr:disease resistance protein L6-like [Syzygium oleosum]XP_056162455.1 disease resistance protein L6-like [Syzygium oleosum]XP_056162456.1 disease resistance protein L6-like [Syzygium oleosum]XP_056162457.1 disease resistance protein L6-like [Syzygium oleosum]XP_056162458.1 disease resistance protein L6-like [Syzygium oleosum]XP_056162459.1 disease resistance protein L6-like [Syzygium oleosum]XP_056162460.1 disease resistance protein L6-like [Syzygium oleosum]XP_056162461.1 disease resistanc